MRDLSQLANFAQVDNRQYRLIKSVTPGPYVFVLQATKEVPRRLSHPSRKTIGLRVPEHAITLALLEALGQPLLGSTLILPPDTEPLNDAEEIRDRLEKQIDLVIDAGACAAEPSTVIDLTGAAAGAGAPGPRQSGAVRSCSRKLSRPLGPAPGPDGIKSGEISRQEASSAFASRNLPTRDRNPRHACPRSPRATVTFTAMSGA